MRLGVRLSNNDDNESYAKAHDKEGNPLPPHYILTVVKSDVWGYKQSSGSATKAIQFRVARARIYIKMWESFLTIHSSISAESAFVFAPKEK